MQQDLYKSLKLVSECPVCRRKDFPAEIKLIQEQDEGHLLHIQCKNCESCIVVLISLGEHGLNLVGVLTDLGSEEVKKFIHRGPLDSDEIIELHNMLQKKDFINKVIGQI